MDDQSIVGYTITVGYLLSSLLLFYSLFFCRADCYDSMESKRSTLLWPASATLALLLGINKQLDLQTYLTQSGRELFRSLDLYSERRNAQIFASVLLISTIGGAAVYSIVVVRRFGWGMRITVLGLAICMAYVVLRLFSIHHVDHWFRVDMGGWTMSWIVELTGAGMTLFGVGVTCARCRRSTTDKGTAQALRA
jgi:hypothetical protein